MAAMANPLLGVAVQLGFLIADPASAARQPAEQLFIADRKSIDKAYPNHSPRSGDSLSPSPAESVPVSREQRSRGLEASSLRLAMLSKTNSQTLQARFAFHTLRYAIATNNYFHVRHANEDCTQQVAAWNRALNAAKRANINTYLRDMPPDCPLR